MKAWKASRHERPLQTGMKGHYIWVGMEGLITPGMEGLNQRGMSAKTVPSELAEERFHLLLLLPHQHPRETCSEHHGHRVVVWDPKVSERVRVNLACKSEPPLLLERRDQTLEALQVAPGLVDFDLTETACLTRTSALPPNHLDELWSDAAFLVNLKLQVLNLKLRVLKQEAASFESRRNPSAETSSTPLERCLRIPKRE
ncbi:hypothetical protein EV361DRAFT_874960 [Lentinula raphanica]|nr:hypothetical protein EV361DRAFT_874960 [Lentinula raphanica]